MPPASSADCCSCPWRPKHFWNVNLPHPLAAEHPPDWRFCGLDTQPHRYHYRLEGRDLIYDGSIHQRPRDPGRDVEVCFGGKVAITRIALGTTSPDPAQMGLRSP